MVWPEEVPKGVMVCDRCGYEEKSWLFVWEFLKTKMPIACPKCGTGELMLATP